MGLEFVQVHFIGCDSFVLSIRAQNIIGDFKNIETLFDFGNPDKIQVLFNKINKKVVGKITTESPMIIWIDEFICLRSKAYSFKCNDENTIKLQGIFIACSKNIKFEELKKMFRWPRISKKLG